MSIYDFEVKKADGTVQSLSELYGKVILIVNSATKCGFTNQYEDLKNLHKKYSAKGLEILDFPCNQFGGQAPGSSDEIQEFCTLHFNIPYLLYAKIDVNGKNESELYTYLKAQKEFKGFNNHKHELNSLLHEMLLKQDANYEKKSDIKWNFTKFLVDRDGKVIERFEPTSDIHEIDVRIAELLQIG